MKGWIQSYPTSSFFKNLSTFIFSNCSVYIAVSRSFILHTKKNKIELVRCKINWQCPVRCSVLLVTIFSCNHFINFYKRFILLVSGRLYTFYAICVFTFSQKVGSYFSTLLWSCFSFYY